MSAKDQAYIRALETELATERAHLRALRETISVGTCTVDPRGRVVALNPAGERLLGWSEVACLGKGLHQLIQCRLEQAPSDAAVCPLTQVLGTGESLWPTRVIICCRDGAFRPVELQGIPFQHRDGLGALLSLRDLSDELQFQADLQHATRVLEESPNPIVELDAWGNLIYANPAMMALLEQYGFTPDAWPAILPANIAQLVQECLRFGNTLKDIAVTRHRKHYGWTFFPVPYTRLVRGYGRDLTTQKRKEKQLLRAKEDAEAADRTKTEFLATMSHELRTPLGVIIGYTSILLEDTCGPLTAEQADLLRRVDTNARELLDLISTILDVSRLEAGRLPLEVRDVYVPALLEQIKAETQGLQEQSGLAFVWQVDDDFPLLQTDPGKLKTVLKDLIGNAVKFTDQGSITVEVHGRIGGVEMRVTDTGRGIPREALTLIFEPFRQLEGVQPRRYGGTGLGLHIVKRLLDLLGGAIEVDSVVGQGSTFGVWMPANPPPAPPVG